MQTLAKSNKIKITGNRRFKSASTISSNKGAIKKTVSSSWDSTLTFMLFSYIGFAFLLFFLIGVYIWENQELLKISAEIKVLREKKLDMKKENDQLQVKLSLLSGRNRIESYARDKLDMRYPTSGEVIFLQPSGSSKKIK